MPDNTAPPPDRILVARGPGETRAALLAGDAVLEVVHRRDGAVQAGAVYFARAGARVPGMPGVFVHYGRAVPGVLKAKQPLAEGSGFAVRVVVPERADKGAELALAPDVPVPADGAPGTLLKPAPDPALAWWTRYKATIAEIACSPPSEAPRLAALLGPAAPIRAERDDGALFADVDEAIEAALERTVALPCGGSIIIETTAAVTAIDVNAGPADPDVANREALAAVARALRLRNLAGHLVVDIIPTRRKAALPRLLQELTGDDPTPTRVAGLTPLGMIELTRQRLGLSLAETLCAASGVVSAQTEALNALRAAVRFGFAARAASVTLDCALDVAAQLAGPLAQAAREAEAVLKCEIVVRGQGAYPRERIELRT